MKHKVLIMRCDEYDPQRISGVIKQGMDECRVTPKGRTFLKPNCVTAHSELFPHAYTRPEFLEGVIMAVKAKGADIRELAVVERCGITLPTRWAFKEAGYMPVLSRHGVKAVSWTRPDRFP